MLQSAADQTQEQKDILARVKGRFDASEKLCLQLRQRWDQWYGLSRNYRRWSREHAQATNQRERDEIVNEVKRNFGDDLFVPMAHVVIETNVPRVLVGDPTLLNVRALQEQAKPYEKPVREMYHQDLSLMSYKRRIQESVRSGLRYGLGVQKLYWKKEMREQKLVKPRILGLGRRLVNEKVVLADGPWAESRDIRDFFWDPSGHDMQSLGYLVDRFWRPTEYVLRKMKEGDWAEIDPEVVRKSASSSKRAEIWSPRYEAAGLSNFSAQGNEEHEVWEYWDREKVFTVLNGEFLVKEDDNPFLHGDFPFQIFRPTIVEHEFVGIGEVEPIAHLLYELNSLRGQRRDAATLALNRGFFYQAGGLDPAQIQTGIGVFNPVFGIPSEIIQPMPFTDIPQSGVSEEESIKADIELTSAMSEAITGAGGEGTATETQLVQAAAGKRTQGKAENLFIDLELPAVKQMQELYLQHLTEEDQARSVTVENGESANEFDYQQVGPEAIGAALEIAPDDPSKSSDDPMKQRQDAVELLTALAPFAEQLNIQKAVTNVLREYGIENPESWLHDQVTSTVQAIGAEMQRRGVPDEQITEILHAASAPPGQKEEPQHEEEPTSNGAAPQPEPEGAAHGS